MDKTLEEFKGGGLEMEGLSSPGVVMVLGGPDTGKTTLASLLCSRIASLRSTALVDLDMGQSTIGPPTTVAWARAGEHGRKGTALKAEDIYFTGALSPPGSLLPALIGARAMLRRARESCETVVVDTTGLISGPVGTVLKQYKVELLSPDTIIALQRDSELEPVLSAFAGLERPVIHRVRAPLGARRRDAAQRAEFRAGRFREYFKGSSVVDVRLEETGIRFTSGGGSIGASLEGRAVSFRRGLYCDLALGMIERAEPGALGRSGRLLVKTPLAKGAGFTTIVIGVCSITL